MGPESHPRRSRLECHAPSGRRRRTSRTTSKATATGTTGSARAANRGNGIDRDALLGALFPQGVPPRESVIREVAGTIVAVLHHEPGESIGGALAIAWLIAGILMFTAIVGSLIVIHNLPHPSGGGLPHAAPPVKRIDSSAAIG